MKLVPILRAVAAFLLAALTLAAMPSANAQFSESVVHTFCAGGGACSDGSLSLDGLVNGADGNFYGVTGLGGASNGTVYKVTPSGTLTTLHNFNGGDGLLPASRLVQGPDGAFYGETNIGGSNSQGGIFRITNTGAFTLLYSFTGGADGGNPVVGLTLGSDGNFYGVTSTGGAHSAGTAFKVTSSGTLTTLHAFCSSANCADGNGPYTGMVQSSDGNYYGTTQTGGATNHGTIFQLTPSGTLTVLYSFTGASDGQHPVGSLSQDSQGRIYGVTNGGATSGNGAAINGTLFQFTLTGAASGTLATLHAFSGAADGRSPYGGPMVGSDGSIWGATTAGGSNNDGAVYLYLFSINQLLDIYNFSGGSNGNGGYGVFSQAPDGTFYSTTVYGGSPNDGIIYHFAYNPGLVAPVTVTAPANATVGTPFTLSLSATNAWSLNMQQCYAFQTTGGTITALGQVPVTKSSTAVTGSLAVTPTAAGTATYAVTCGGQESNSTTVTVASAAPVAPTGPAGSTTTTVTATPNPVAVNGNVTITATVASPSGTPTGTVNFVYNGYTLASVPLTNGAASLAPSLNGLSAGSYTVTANFVPTGIYSASSANVIVVIGAQAPSAALDNTSASMFTNTMIAPVGDAAVFTVTLTAMPPAGKTQANTPTGTVTLSQGGNIVATGTLSVTGVATLYASTTGMAPGDYSYTANYLGDSASNPCTSNTVIVQVGGSIPNSGTTSVNVTVNPLANRHAISPLIYGSNFPPNAAYIKTTGTTFTRWSGESDSNYNWLTNNTNTGGGYYFFNQNFLSVLYPNSDPMYSSSQNYVAGVAAAGATAMISIGAQAWVAKDATSYSYPVSEYGAQCGVLYSNPDIGNGVRSDCVTSIPDTNLSATYIPMKDTPGSNDAADTVYRNQWVESLAQNFGSSPHVYGIDNEIEFWSTFHLDTWGPTGTGYSDFRNVFLTEAPQIKQWDPNAIVIGPDNCCWYYYWHTENGSDDHATHANNDFLPWWLNEVLWADTVAGKRSLDWFDLHVYMNNSFDSLPTAQANATYLRVMRDLWDPTYVNEQPEFNQYATSMQPVPLIALRIPRMRALVNSIYPNTPLDFTEWNRLDTQDSSFVTALMSAEEYAIFGMENVYAAARWPAPGVTTPCYWALMLMRNYDGNNSGFAPISVQAQNNGNVNLFSSYAGINQAGTQMTVLLINKDPNNQVVASLNLGGFSASSMSTYSMTNSYQSGLLSTVNQPASGSVTLPPYTAMLVVLNGSFGSNPAIEWELNPDVTMVPANGQVTLAPKILSGSGTVTLHQVTLPYGNPSSGYVQATINNATVTNTSNGSITFKAGPTPGFYQFVATGSDSNGVTQQQGGWIFVQNPSSTLTKSGDNQSASRGSTITLSATLNPGQSGATLTGAGIFFTASAGTLSAREVTTNSSGVATVSLTLPSSPGAVTVTAEGPYGLGHPVVTFTATAQ